ncbi:hypothetical protein NKH18_19515 [Streptomyces sp. M10(2022)]
MPEATTAANQAAADREFHESIPKAIKFAVDRGAEVINISLGSRPGRSSWTMPSNMPSMRALLFSRPLGMAVMVPTCSNTRPVRLA